MTVPVLPAGLEALRNYIQTLEGRIDNIEAPQQPMAAYAMTSASLTGANAKTFVNCIVFVSDLNILAHSNGAHWYREDTGGVIV